MLDQAVRAKTKRPETQSAPRALFLCPGVWMGGPVVFFRRACELLPQFGWNCKLCVTGSRNLLFDTKDWPSDLEVLPRSYTWPALAQNIAAAIERYDPDVVVGCSMHGAPLAIRLLSNRPGGSPRYLDIIHVDAQSEYERILDNVDVCDAVAGVSASIVEKAQHMVGSNTRVFRLHYPVPCPEAPVVRRRHGPLKIGYIGRIVHYEKRIFDTVPILAGLLRYGVDFEFVFVGDGSDREALQRRLAEEIGGRAPVRFTGWLRSDAVLDEARRLDVIVLVSEIEGQPIALMEAMATGAVPVVTPLPGMRELVTDAENGFLVPVGDTSLFAERFAQLAADPDLMARMSYASWRRVAKTNAPGPAMTSFTNSLSDLVHGSIRVARPRCLSFPTGRLSRLGVPQIVQGTLRRARGRELH